MAQSLERLPLGLRSGLDGMVASLSPACGSVSTSPAEPRRKFLLLVCFSPSPEAPREVKAHDGDKVGAGMEAGRSIPGASPVEGLREAACGIWRCGQRGCKDLPFRYSDDAPCRRGPGAHRVSASA